MSSTSKILPVAVDPALSKDVKAFLKGFNTGAPGIETMTPAAARKVLDSLQASVKVDLSGVHVSEKTITADGFTLQLHIVRPEDSVKGAVLPVFMFNHGGGFVLGDFPTHHRMVRDLVVLSGAVAVFTDYSLSPEAKYPQAVHQVYAATKWVAEHGEEINVDGKRLAVVGNSAGGNLSAVTALLAKEKHGPHIRLQVLMWPLVTINYDTESFQHYGEDRYLTTPLVKWLNDNYTTNPEDRKQIYHSPLLAEVEQLVGLPPALIQVADADVLRDEGEAYGRKLDAAGVKVTTVRYNGMIHDFGLLNALAEIPQTRSLFVQAAAELKKYLFA